MKNALIIISLIQFSFPSGLSDESTQTVCDVVIAGALYQMLTQDLIMISRFIEMYSTFRNESQKIFQHSLSAIY